jgi:hypothetical protein
MTERLGRSPLGHDLSAGELATLHSMIQERVQMVAEALVEEAATCDDVIDSASAQSYLEDRLVFFGELITPELADALRGAFTQRVRAWSEPRPGDRT